jgi:hypothetical protein
MFGMSELGFTTESETDVGFMRAIYKLDLLSQLDIDRRYYSLGHYHDCVEYKVTYR